MERGKDEASAIRWYGELRRQNYDATALLGSSLPPHALHGILFILLRDCAILGDRKTNAHDDK